MNKERPISIRSMKAADQMIREVVERSHFDQQDWDDKVQEPTVQFILSPRSFSKSKAVVLYSGPTLPVQEGRASIGGFWVAALATVFIGKLLLS